MTHDPLHDPDLRAFEAGLSSRPPQMSSREKDQILFACGLAAGKKMANQALRTWQTASAVLGLSLFCLIIPRFQHQYQTQNPVAEQTSPVIVVPQKPLLDGLAVLAGKPLITNLDVWQLPLSGEALNDQLTQLKQIDPHLRTLTVGAMTRMVLEP